MSFKHHALTALIAVVAAPAFAQNSLHSTDFEGATSGWQTHGLWDVDGTPASAPGGHASSGSKSLNFNNGTDYAGQNRGAAASPPIAIMAGSTVEVRFRCNYQTETTGTQWDKRSVLVKLNSSVVQEHQLGSGRRIPAIRRCSAMGTWHEHVLRVPTHTAAMSIQVEFVFDSVDDYSNGFAGWFIDDFSVVEPGMTPNLFNKISRRTADFRQYTATLEVLPGKQVRLLQSSPTARYAPIDGTATDAEFAALTDAVQRGRLGSIPSVIPDPRTYIVAPTSFLLEVDSPVSTTHNTIGGTLGYYAQWTGQLAPVMDALQAIQARLLGSTPPPPPGDDHGDTIQDATQLSLDPNVPATNGKIDPAGDVDYFVVAEIVPMIAIFPPPVSDYTFETTVVGNMDTYIELYGGDGTLLASNDDGGQGLASRLTYRGIRGVALYAKVRHYSANGTGDYTVRASSSPVISLPPPQPTDDHGDDAASATTIQLGDAPTGGEISPAGDVDMFQFLQIVPAIFPPPTFTYVVEAQVVGNMDTVVELIGPDGTTVVASNDDAPGMGYGSKIVHTTQAGNVRYIRVRHYSSSGTGSYTVKVSTQ